jgi:hypothetical protein
MPFVSCKFPAMSRMLRVIGFDGLAPAAAGEPAVEAAVVDVVELVGVELFAAGELLLVDLPDELQAAAARAMTRIEAARLRVPRML